MHDEVFITTQGTIRFHLADAKTVDAGVGDLVTVPTRCTSPFPGLPRSANILRGAYTVCDVGPHTFSNPFDEEAKFINTYTPAFYINYFKLLERMVDEGTPMNPQVVKTAMVCHVMVVRRRG